MVRALLIVAAAAVAPFLSTLPAYFLGDDFGLIQLFSQKPPFHFISLFWQPWTELIYGYRTDELRPLVALSYQVDWWAGGNQPVSYHMDNILLHMLDSLLVFGLARYAARLGMIAATFAGVLFAVLAAHAEPVAWISGRADSIPALFFFGTMLGFACWRRSGRPWAFVVAVGACFLALFSKQSAIVLPVLLVLYDWVVAGRKPWRNWLPHLPFVAMTAGYLGLRLLLFGNMAREDGVRWSSVVDFLSRQPTYLKMLATGTGALGTSQGELFWIGILVAPLFVLMIGLAFYSAHRTQGRTWRLVLFFGPIWWVINVVPLLVTYLSIRHLYVPSAGIVIVLAVGVEAILRERREPLRRAGMALAGALVTGQLVVLVWAVSQWNATAAISERMVRDVEHEALTSPPGSLLLVGAPRNEDNVRVFMWTWGWSAPFVLQPPFMAPEVTERVSILTRQDVYCCYGTWPALVQNAVSQWAARADHPPIIVLNWKRPSGELVEVSDAQDPSLRERVMSLLGNAPGPALARALEMPSIP